MFSSSLRFRPIFRSRPATAAFTVIFALCSAHAAPVRTLAADTTDAQPEAAPAKTATLCGVIKSRQGAPVCDAAVTLRRATQDDVTTSTDDKGRFAFSNLAPGPAALIASSAQERSVRIIDIKPGAADVEVIFDRQQSDYAVASPITVTASPASQSLSAQTPAQTPAQRDATRPPGSEQRQTPGVPPEARTRPADPTAAPGAERPNPQAPPGATNATPTGPQPSATPSSPDLPAPSTTIGNQTDVSNDQEQQIREPLLTLNEPRPVPPMPSLARVGITGGDTRTLALNDAIRRALENNNDIEIARNDVRLAESFLNSLQGFYEPFFQFNPQISNFVTPVSSTLSGSTNSLGSVKSTNIDVNNSFIKNFVRGGGRYEFFFNNSHQTTNQRFATLNPRYTSSAGVTFTQPLWRDRSIDNTRRSIRIQRKRLEQSDADFRRRTIEVIAQVQRAYWELVFAIRDEQNQIANLKLARENFRRTEASVAAGASAPLERAEIQTELSNRESQLLLASQSVSIAENNLKSLMLKDPLAPEWGSALIPTDEPKFDDTPVSLPDALTEARNNRPELRRLRLQQDVSDVDLQYFRNQTKPRVDVQATVASTGQAGTFVPQQGVQPAPGQAGGYGRNLLNLFGADGRNIVVGVTIQLPLKNRTAQANLTSARIEREQLAAQTRSQEQIVEVEVRNSVQAVETARRRVLSARQARENAQLQLAGERRLYQVGRSTTFLLFQRENALVNARNQELRAETDYNKALAELQRATSTTLRANNVIIETPTLP